jgi:putative SOS response-associated peptidase YedK
MCGRFDNLIARDAYRGLFKANRLPKSNFPPRYNIAPTDQISIVRIDPRDGEREVDTSFSCATHGRKRLSVPHSNRQM